MSAAPPATSGPGRSGSAAKRHRVAVTGMGLLSPAGAGLAAYERWESGGRGPGRIADFDPHTYIASPKLLRSMHRTFQLAAAVSVLAMRAAGLPDADSVARAGFAPEQAGIAAALADLSPVTSDLLRVLASMPPPRDGGELDWARFADVGVHELHPFRRLLLLANMAAAHTSLLFNFQGPSFTFTSGAEAGAQTVAEAFWTIGDGLADLMVCEAADSPEQTFLSQPPPELAAALIMEEWSRAQARGAPILAEILDADDACSLRETGATGCALPLPIPYEPSTVSRWRPAASSLAAAVLKLDQSRSPYASIPVVSLQRLIAAPLERRPLTTVAS